MVPSVAREAVVSFRTTRALAIRAAERGYLAFTFSFRGDGDSGPVPDGADLDRVWAADLAAVVAEARRSVAGLPVHIVGLRLGAAVLAAYHETEPAHPGEVRMLWEPVAGRSFLTRSQAIRKLTVPIAPASDGVEVAGAWYSPEQAAALRRLRLPADPASAGLTVRRETDRALADRIASVSPHFAEIPQPALEAILDELPATPATALPDWSPVRTVEVTGADGSLIRETHCTVGPHRLPAIRTEPVAVPVSVAVGFTPMGSEVRSGPGDLWATAARDLAAAGAVCVRADRRGLGDALDPAELHEPRPYTAEAVEDVADLARELGSTGLPVIGVGVCSGAWGFLNAAAAAPVHTVVAANNIDWNPDGTAYDDAFYDKAFRFDASIDQATGGDEPPSESGRDRVTRAWHDLRTRVGIRYPQLRALLRPQDRYERVAWLLEPIPTTTTVRLVLGRNEHARLRYLGGDRDLARLRARGHRIDIVECAELDHSLLAQRARRAFGSELLRVVTDLTRRQPPRTESAAAGSPAVPPALALHG